MLVTLGLTGKDSAADAGIYKKVLGSGATTLITSNEEIRDIIKILLYIIEILGLLTKV